MIKSDAKPPLSDKPMHQQVAPQVIAYQDKVPSSAYSSVLRVITRRFLSLLKPSFKFCILKNIDDVAEHLARVFPWDSTTVRALENDFSKYDKSQGEFCLKLKAYVYEKMGMSPELLARWIEGQTSTALVSLALGIELHVAYQQKSGDGATAFANGLINILAICFAYYGTKIIGGAVVGDDSVLLAEEIVATEQSIAQLQQIFNLEAKFFISDHVYFASTFFNIDKSERTVYPVPDPVKKAQRLGRSQAADAPWADMYESFRQDCDPYLRMHMWAGLEPCVLNRYKGQATEADITHLFNALATVTSSFEDYRGCWEEDSTRVVY
jgi:hypothetical protein